MNENGTTNGPHRPPLLRQPWWARQVTAPPPLVRQPQSQAALQSRPAAYLEATYEPGVIPGQGPLTTTPPNVRRGETDGAEERLADSAPASVPRHLRLTVSDWPQSRHRRMGQLSPNRHLTRARTSRLTATPPPRLRGREHLSEDEELSYMIDLVR